MTNTKAQPIKIAILAMGGEGGGVLADWIVDMGEANGYVAQTTSVPGVAQRTGATIYYVELYPVAQAEADGGRPVLALMPLPGDVDVVLASELMEAGRAVQRGLVTNDRTTLIASTHRVFSIAEKSALGDGRVDSTQLLAHTAKAAKRFIRFDMAQAAEASGSVISAVLFGALAGSGVLPFSRAQFEATIERGGVGVKPSLKAFGGAFARAQGGDDGETPPEPALATPTPQPRHPAVRALVERVQNDFPPAAQDFLLEGVRRLIDYQDLAYAGLYLDRMATIAALPGTGDHRLLRETARHLALWMSYEDTARVAALKTRATRFERVRGEARVQAGQVLAINEYMHPRLQEICETLPGGIGRWLMNSSTPKKFVERFTQKGRVIQTSSLRGYLMLRTVAAMKRWRRSTMRYAEENRRIEEWLQRIAATAQRNPELAVELAQCQRLVKGYSDTHERGIRNYDTVMRAVERAGAQLAPATLRELRDAALADEHGHKLQAALAQHALA
ncbi:indolepyruvate ferredoxin oxidoreductase beta subunit [Variovorax boronicumulans]|uniref:indolepyruvate oxidoreductase subunit beta family protein n=1 Tax=Variovorax TaxID=34072 RepID=UPI0027883EB3|nr:MULTISPECIES: indolepyruvate oxidoreductase subunit beta family protein [Variovorax]MDQ0032323.1 indolepyruvate ferredoxin oxidoreductase beta subunit [Variovorax boronicumulans]MDQ0040259.1 indolepyruvate ferredoxin oxidoreductase beta subunit [Variovorax boronicumulans]MDQ0609884.1 indolepyruvate ferredoxin oxidoreductase beta subunit [Variovorax sp. W1I1]